MDEIIDRFIKNTHNWKKKIHRHHVNGRHPFGNLNDDCGYIISAIYVPHNTTSLELDIFNLPEDRYITIRWFESLEILEPLEDILSETRDIQPSRIDLDVYKRVVPYHPFIYVTSEVDIELSHSEWESDPNFYVEYYLVDIYSEELFPQNSVDTGTKSDLLLSEKYHHLETEIQLKLFHLNYRIDSDLDLLSRQSKLTLAISHVRHLFERIDD